LIRARFLRTGFGLADRVVPSSLRPRLDADALIAAAEAEPSPEAYEGLRRLLAAIDKDSALSLFGRFTVRFDMIRLLRNAARIEQAHRANPALSAAPVAAPIFVLGLPRSGTTFLHTLLAEDPTNLVPRNWQTLNPAPRVQNFNPARDATAKKVNRQLKLFAGMAPGFADLHPIHADSPQECSEITACVFESLRFDTTFRVPDYLTWLESHGDLAGFRFHKKFLQFLQSGLTGRWVLKCPDHTFSLDSILSIYPDARFVIVHRDPVDVFASVAHLTEVLRMPFLRNIDAAEIGAQVAARWIDGANRLLAFDRRADIDTARKIHVQHDTLIEQPMQVIDRIYQQFGLKLGPAAATAMQHSLRANPRGGYAPHAPYALNRFGIRPEQLKPHFAPYVKAYCA
jgi:hypothetical protein